MAMQLAPRPHVVRARRAETADTVTLDLAPRSGEAAGFRPGQFSMLYAFGVGEVPVSISGRSEGGLLHTVRAVGAVTTALCEAAEGSMLGVRGPYGRGWQVDTLRDHDVLVVAGGLGLAPLRQAVIGLLAERYLYGRLVVVIGARSDDLLLYPEEIDSWRRRAGVEVHVTVDHAGPLWRGHVGVVTDVLFRLGVDPARTRALVCGPEMMMRRTAISLVDAGVPPEQIQLSLERNMKCAVAQCGHCQLAPLLLCRDGPVVTWDRAAPLVGMREL